MARQERVKRILDMAISHFNAFSRLTRHYEWSAALPWFPAMRGNNAIYELTMPILPCEVYNFIELFEPLPCESFRRRFESK
jgi:hypothetical protein